MSTFQTSYDHKKYESKWFKFWDKNGWFKAETKSSKPPYTILMPPPNVTSRLHMGHGLNNTIQDILIRWKRMSGYNCCWLPGTDHAGIATQMMVEQALDKKGISRIDLGRDAFFKKCVEWQEENGGIIIDQLKKLGSSCDWQREAYTLSPELSLAVRKIFVDLYEKGLIYRGERLVNWDPVLKTAISDDELVSKECPGHLWYFKYPVDQTESEFVTIATTRPETMFGDTAVAVHPDDTRFNHLIGKHVVLPFTNRKIPILGDEYVKSDFGSGCLKITPAHDPNDYEIGKRHNLEFINILDADGSLNSLCPKPFYGMDRFEARKLVLKKIKELGLFVKTENTKHAVPYSDRSKVPIEPMLSKQWYVKMKELAQPAIKAAKEGELKFYPASWEKTYLHWLENIQDWCISRQLWWGHRIPIWYCNDCNKVTTGEKDPSKCSHCNSKNIHQDEDMLDTWFSSWLWPLSPFGWPKETQDLQTFFPSAVLITAPEIIYLWVARMIMVGYHTKGELPFIDVYFNATICDKQGRKFSKTLGNGIDPLDVIEKYGADSVRYTCVSLAPLGGRVKMTTSDFEAGHKFINKIWNAHRFILGKISPGEKIKKIDPKKLDLPSKWLLQQLKKTSLEMDGYLNKYQINEAVESLFHLTWRSFCDWGLESSKDFLDHKDEQREQILSVLIFVFEGIMRLSSPIIPFISEEIWQNLPHHPEWVRKKGLMVSQFPTHDMFTDHSKESEQWESVQSLITQIRSVRTQAKVPPKEKVQVIVKGEEKFHKLVDHSSSWIKRLANVDHITCELEITKPENCLIATGKGWTLYVPVGKYIDFDKERTRLQNEVGRVQKIVTGLEGKLSNPNFKDRAPADVVKKSQDQLDNMKTQLLSLQENLNNMK